jgi:hypothetical protein
MIDDRDAALRDAFAAAAEEAPPAAGCPDPDRLWAGARGELDPEDAGALVRHTATCPACAEAWRLARELPPPADVVDLAAARPRRRGTVWFAASAVLAAAAAVLLYLRFRGGGGDERSEYRGGAPEIRLLVAPGTELARDQVVLRWAPAGEGARYDVHLLTAELQPLDRALDIGTTSHPVPAARLSAVPPGAELYWRVEAVLPGGRRLASPTGRIRLR